LKKLRNNNKNVGEQLLPDDEPQNDKVDQLMMLGFTRHQSKYALGKVNGDSNQAAEWLFMNVDDVPPEPSSNGAHLIVNAFNFLNTNFGFRWSCGGKCQSCSKGNTHWIQQIRTLWHNLTHGKFTPFWALRCAHQEE
jgi:hypothetical protein